MIHLGTIPAGATIPIPFTTYDGSTGASVTCSGLAVTDIEIYKDGSATQRSSDAGIALLDTDGIDFDGITGLHGFSIDLSDNTDSGFYAVGSFYWVVVSAITVDSQTVTFLAATFRIGPAESITGYPKSDMHALKGDAQSATDLQDFADAGYDPSTNKVQGVVLTDTVTTYTGNTPQTGDAYAIVNNGTYGNSALETLLNAIIGYIDTEIQAIYDRLGAPAGLSMSADIAAAKADTAAILQDTGTDGVVVAGASKTGYSLAATGLDAISTTAPSGVASNFREMVVAVWRWIYKKTTLTSTDMIAYADDGTTPIASMTVSDDGTTQTKGAAS